MSSSCAHCNAVEQRGRYCVGCGKLMPPSLLPARAASGWHRALLGTTTPSRCCGSARRPAPAGPAERGGRRRLTAAGAG